MLYIKYYSQVILHRLFCCDIHSVSRVERIYEHVMQVKSTSTVMLKISQRQYLEQLE